MEVGKLLSTPVEAYPIIAGYAYGKVFCDLGCGFGDVIRAVKGIAKGVIGIDKNYYTMINRDFTEFLPEAEVYYMWVGKPEYCYEKIKDKLNGVILIGAHCNKREYSFILNNLCRENLFAYYSVLFKNDLNWDEFSIGVFNHVC